MHLAKIGLYGLSLMFCVTSCIDMADPIVCMSNICLLNARIFTALTAGLMGGFA